MLPIITMEATVVADPELRFTSSGKAVCDVRLVANDRKNVNGKWEDGDPLWMRATVWERLAENVAESVRQGDRVIATGRLSEDEWEDKEGNKRKTLRITANNFALSLLFNVAKAERVDRSKSKSKTDSAPAGPDPWERPATQPDEPPF